MQQQYILLRAQLRLWAYMKPWVSESRGLWKLFLEPRACVCSINCMAAALAAINFCNNNHCKGVNKILLLHIVQRFPYWQNYGLRIIFKSPLSAHLWQFAMQSTIITSLRVRNAPRSGAMALSLTIHNFNPPRTCQTQAATLPIATVWGWYRLHLSGMRSIPPHHAIIASKEALSRKQCKRTSQNFFIPGKQREKGKRSSTNKCWRQEYLLVYIWYILGAKQTPELPECYTCLAVHHTPYT